MLIQSRYVGKLLNRFQMTSLKGSTSPVEFEFDSSVLPEESGNPPCRDVIGAFIFLVVGTGPDISLPVRSLAKQVENIRT